MFQQNCLYTAQGGILCMDENRAKPVLNGFPSKSDVIIEKFEANESFATKKMDDATKRTLQNLDLFYDPKVVVNCETSNFESESKKLLSANMTTSGYSCDTSKCKLDVNSCAPDTSGKDIWNCDVVCNNCCKIANGKKTCKDTFKSKTSGLPVSVKSDGTPAGTNFQRCVSINNTTNSKLDVDGNATCQKLTYQDIGNLMSQCSNKNNKTTQQEEVPIEKFEDFAPAFTETQPPFLDQRVFRSFWF